MELLLHGTGPPWSGLYHEENPPTSLYMDQTDAQNMAQIFPVTHVWEQRCLQISPLASLWPHMMNVYFLSFILDEGSLSTYWSLSQTKVAEEPLLFLEGDCRSIQDWTRVFWFRPRQGTGAIVNVQSFWLKRIMRGDRLCSCIYSLARSRVHSPLPYPCGDPSLELAQPWLEHRWRWPDPEDECVKVQVLFQCGAG